MDDYDSAVARGDDLRLPFRRLHVVLDVLDRPYGAQSNHEHVLRQRLQRLRGGGALDAMWREAPVAELSRTLSDCSLAQQLQIELQSEAAVAAGECVAPLFDRLPFALAPVAADQVISFHRYLGAG